MAPDEIETALRFFQFAYNEDRRVIGEQELRRLRRQEEEQAMARRVVPSAPPSATLNRSEMEQAVKRFQKLIERLRSFDPSSINDRGDTRIEGLEHAVRTV